MRSSSLHSAVLIATLVFLTGCSRSPVAPITDTSSGPDAAPTITAEIPDDPPPPVDGGTPGWRTVTLTAADEGVVNVGRFSLYVRKNSLIMPTTITMKVASAEATECEITVSPDEANAFQQSVILTASTSDIPGFDYATATMLMWKGDWEWSETCAAHKNQENVVGKYTSLGNVKLVSGDKWKNKIGA
jgi:hypothetical protein